MPKFMKRPLHATLNGMEQNVRARSAVLLEQVLVDLLDLASQVKTCHWVTRGPDFLSLHEYLDKLEGILRGAADGVAERITALGGQPIGTSRVVAKSTRMEELPDVFAQTDVLKALAERLAHLGNEVRSGIHRAAGIDDPVTADILTGLCATLDKQVWIVEAWSHPGR